MIPIGRDRYELYCETPAPVGSGDEEPGNTWLSRLRQRFAVMVHEAETREGESPATEIQGGWWDRVQARLLAWVAERVAEQRLLWNLRREEAVRLVHPDDMTFDQAQGELRRMMKADHDRHAIWLAVNGVLLVGSGILALVPGPNLVAYYFAFRVVGHWLSLRGASQGLHRVTWTGESESALTALRGALELTGRAREDRIADIAERLGLPYLARFVERLATR